MITPKFDITQDHDYIIVTIHVPYIKISDTEIFIEGTEFKFFIKPYYLRLNFSHTVVENGKERARYDVDSGDIVVHIPKKIPGETFRDLDMISKLLAPKSNAVRPKIDVVSEAMNEENTIDPNTIDDDFTWEWDQNYPEDKTHILSTEVTYGFCNRYSRYFGRFVDEYPELIDLRNPEECLPVQRKSLMEDNLMESFDMEHYLSDFIDLNDFMGDALHYEPCYITHPKTFTIARNEQDLLLQLPRTRVVVEKKDIQGAMIGLVDILYAFAFDHRITTGEASVESAWNVCKLSSQLSWLYTPDTLQECLVMNFSRALTFPLYRHYDFCEKVLSDVTRIIAAGRSTILKCLLGVFEILRKHEFYYLLNNVFIKDYCLWIQNISDEHINNLSAALNQLGNIDKSDLPFPLDEFEIMVEYDDTFSDSSLMSDVSDEDLETSSEESMSGNESKDELYLKSPEKEPKQSIPSFNIMFCGEEKIPANDVSCLNVAVEQLSIANTETGVMDDRPLIEEL